ncbi:MAG: hypothetical protein PHF11_07675 [Candidatus Omnitrophica bacterium]|nr:hypothetical protein [Candidatus Omnitrophota bacterium]
MKKSKLINIKTIFLAIAIIAAVLVLRIAVHTKALSSAKLSGPGMPTQPETVDIKPAPHIYDLDKIKETGGLPEIAGSADVKYENEKEVKDWKDADPVVKKEMMDELDANIAKSKKALEANPNDIMAKRILIVSERRKIIEKENFEGRIK